MIIAMDATFAGLGALCAGLGSLLSGLAAYKAAAKRRNDEEHKTSSTDS